MQCIVLFQISELVLFHIHPSATYRIVANGNSLQNHQIITIHKRHNDDVPEEICLFQQIFIHFPSAILPYKMFMLFMLVWTRQKRGQDKGFKVLKLPLQQKTEPLRWRNFVLKTSKISLQPCNAVKWLPAERMPMNSSTFSSARGGAFSSVSNSRFLWTMLGWAVGNEPATIDWTSMSPITDKIVASSRTKPLKEESIALTHQNTLPQLNQVKCMMMHTS